MRMFIGNVHSKFRVDRICSSGDDRPHRQTHKTRSSQYSATPTGGGGRSKDVVNTVDGWMQVVVSYPRSVGQPLGVVPRGPSQRPRHDLDEVQLRHSRRLPAGRGRSLLARRRPPASPHHLGYCPSPAGRPTPPGLPCRLLLGRGSRRRGRLHVPPSREY